MSFSSLFIHRPIAAILLALAVSVMGAVVYFFLPVAPLPQMSIPMISVTATLSGASPQNMASSVATPLERALGVISGLQSMSSTSSDGRTRIFLEFALNKDIDEAAREVQGAINSARPLLPSSLKKPPSYRKVNPSSMPIMALSLTSAVYDQGKLYDLASSILQQRLAQIPGVGEVTLGGSSLPAVRVDLNPYALSAYGLSLQAVRQAINLANTRIPTGLVENDQWRWQIATNGQLSKASEFRELILRAQDGSTLRLKDVANVYDYIESEFNAGFYNDQKAINILIRRDEAANIIKTVDMIKSSLPVLRELIPAEVNLSIVQDRSPSIRATLYETQFTLFVAIALVIVVVWGFLGRLRATLIPIISVPVSLLATLVVMYFLEYSLNTISLMALIVATGFVVDDSIVVLENIMRHIEKGLTPMQAALRGAHEVSFTVVSMSLSLIAVFIPLLLMDNLLGRLFQEFAVTLSVSILISLVVSLSLIPSLCARWLNSEQLQAPNQSSMIRRLLDVVYLRMLAFYSKTLRWVLRFKFITIMIFIITVGLNVYLFVTLPKGLFPTQDTGVVMGFFRVDQGTSFQGMLPKLDYYRKIIMADPNVQSLMGYAGGRGGSNSSFLMIQLKPVNQRTQTAQQVIDNLRKQFGQLPGTQLSLVVQQDIRAGGGPPGGSMGSYDLSLQASDIELLDQWLPRVQQAITALPEIEDVMAATQNGGRRMEIVVDTEVAKRLGIDMELITSSLGNLYSRSQASVLYSDLNQYYVILGVANEYAQDPEILQQLTLVTNTGERVPLSAVARFEIGTSPLSINHRGLMVANSLSYNLAPGYSLEQATQAIDEALARISLPTHLLQVGASGNAMLFQQNAQQQPLLILAAIIVMYLVLGVLYESYVLPLTILSTLPSAGLGALLALILMGMEFTLIALIGVFLLIGIVKKNAIMMVDFAISRERQFNETPEQAIYEACLVRFRPIMMTTVSAMFGALPLVLATGAGVELRQPLGVAIVGGLVISQILTLYSTPVIYLLLDQLRYWVAGRRSRQKNTA